MVRSIRWRLAVGSMLLTLLTVCAVGVVALLLMQRYLVQQERAFLTANAEAIAGQAAAYMPPFGAAPPLQQLAQTAAFLGDASVRIVDNAQVPLADSTQVFSQAVTGSTAAPVYLGMAPPTLPVTATDLVWTVVAREFTVATEGSTPPESVAGEVRGVTAMTTTVSMNPVGAIPAATPATAQSANVIVVQRSPSFWGDRLRFGDAPVAAMPIMESLPAGAAVVYDIAPPLSGHAYPAQAVVARDDVIYHAALPVPAQPAAATGWAAAWVDGWERQFKRAARAVVSSSWWQMLGFQPTDVVTAPIQVDGVTLGVVEVGRATGLVDEPLAAIRRALAIAAGASSLLGLAVGLVMSRTLTAPIQHLAHAAAAMSSGDLTARAPVVGHDELAALARQFNHMADALHRSFADLAAERDTLRRFVADASHELRTPITALRTFNELLQGPAREDRSAHAEFLAESQSQIARLEWITRNLLDLSRWDGGMATLALAEVDVGELVTSIATPFRALAQERGLELTVSVPVDAVNATVDEQRLALAVGNLLDNALKFTPEGGRVEIGVAQEAGRVTLWVADTGSGIAAEDLPHIFERFYRSPRATQSGSGLGLAIVERIVAAHGAMIQVDSHVGEGSRFELDFATGT